jgi:hypothetical protein
LADYSVKLRISEVFKRATAPFERPYFGGVPIRTSAVQLGGSLAGKLSSRLSSIRSSGTALFESSFVAWLRRRDRGFRFR